MDLSPSYVDAQIGLISFLLESGRWTDADRKLEAALAILGTEARLHAMRGVAFAKQGCEYEARGAFERSLQLCGWCMSEQETAIYDALKRPAP